jgi:hypothetical protein
MVLSDMKDLFHVYLDAELKLLCLHLEMITISLILNLTHSILITCVTLYHFKNVLGSLRLSADDFAVSV